MYEWLDLEKSKEHRQYAYARLEELQHEVHELTQIKIEYEKQTEYVASLEKQLSFLQKTLEVVSPKTPEVCKRGGMTYRRAKNVCKNHHR